MCICDQFLPQREPRDALVQTSGSVTKTHKTFWDDVDVYTCRISDLQADEVYISYLREAGLYDNIWQAFAVFPKVKTVGVQVRLARPYNFAVVVSDLGFQAK